MLKNLRPLPRDGINLWQKCAVQRQRRATFFMVVTILTSLTNSYTRSASLAFFSEGSSQDEKKNIHVDNVILFLFYVCGVDYYSYYNDGM